MDINRAEDSSQDVCTACAELRRLKEEGRPADGAVPQTLNPDIGRVPEEARSNEQGGGRALKDIERAYISRVFAETNHNLAKAARILEIDRSTLYSKLKKYGLK